MLTSPPLGSVSRNSWKNGYQAAELLDRLMAGQSPDQWRRTSGAGPRGDPSSAKPGGDGGAELVHARHLDRRQPDNADSRDNTHRFHEYPAHHSPLPGMWAQDALSRGIGCADY
ncbi:MAG: hypothetical protein ACQESR_00550 [Planctomycetota bacterium]